MKRLFVVAAGLFITVSSQAAAEPSAASLPGSSLGQATQVKYRSGKELRFDELLIQGQMKRAEMSVVTGDPSELSDGLLRLRENFLDHAALDLGEEVQ